MTQTIAIVVTAVVSVAAALGIAFAVFKSTARTNVQELYARENEALGKALARQESENARLMTKVDTLATTNAVLQETVSGAAAVRELALEIRREEAARREEHQTQLVLLKDLISIIRRERGVID